MSNQFNLGQVDLSLASEQAHYDVYTKLIAKSIPSGRDTAEQHLPG